MFLALSKILDLFLAPLTWAFLLLLAGWFTRRRVRVAWGLVFAAALELFLFSIPPVADRVRRFAEASAPRTYRADATYDTVIVLGGITEERMPWMDDGKDLTGAAERLTRAFELLREGRARTVLLSGGTLDLAPGGTAEADQLSAQLQGWGVPADRIVVENRSRNTHENAVQSARVVAEHGWQKLLLVTSAVHMPRALGCFHREGLRPDALPVDYRGGVPGATWSFETWSPRAANLELSSEALRELAGRLVYRVKGYSAD